MGITIKVEGSVVGGEAGRAEHYQFATYAHKFEGFVPLRIERLHDRLALGLLSRKRQPDVRVGLSIEISRLESRRTHLALK